MSHGTCSSGNGGRNWRRGCDLKERQGTDMPDQHADYSTGCTYVKRLSKNGRWYKKGLLIMETDCATSRQETVGVQADGK